MARAFRIYEKKRGHRRTGSRWLGRIGEAVFSAVFFLLGCVGVVLLVAWVVIPEWRINHDFLETACTVHVKAVEAGQDIQIEYHLDGKTIRQPPYQIGGSYLGAENKQELLERFENEGRYACWYDPADPSHAVLVRGYSWWLWLLLVVPGSFILIGGGGLIYAALSWGKSAERRAAFAQTAAGLDLLNGGGNGAAFPAIPRGLEITDSPGTALAFRLPMGGSSAWSLLVWLAAGLLWNGVVAGFAAVAVNNHLEGRPDWLLTFFIIPFVLVGFALIIFFVRQLLIVTAVGPTLVEISAHPLLPGRRYEVFVSQAGRFRAKSLELLLVCDEEATYRRGTDTRKESKRVWQQSVFAQQEVAVTDAAPLEGRCQVEVPDSAMHSFKSEHNEVNWKLVVRAQPERWPLYERCFPVIVHPGAKGEASAGGPA